MTTATRPAGFPLRANPTVLSIQDLTVSYGGVIAVSDVSFEVRPGQLVGLIGPNGAGKTSLIDAICGFTPYRGSAVLSGHPLEGLSAQRRSHLGMSRTWQTADLFDQLTVRENLALAAERHSWLGLLRDLIRPGRRSRAADRTESVLSMLGIAEQADSLPDSLPQGQRKLVDVARAVVGSPTLLCLDEPAAGLDSAESAQLGRHLREIISDGTGMILVDHDMGLVLSVCDYIVVLDFGKVIAAGSPQQIRADPRVIDAYIGRDHAAGGSAPPPLPSWTPPPRPGEG